MSRAAALLALALTACTGSSSSPPPPPSHVAAASPTPSADGHFGVFDVAPAGQATAQVSIVSTAGQVVASAPRHGRTRITSGGAGGGAIAPELPYESASGGLVYYLDGDSKLNSLAPNGSVAEVATMPGSAQAHVAFAVDAAGSRVAVSVMDYSQTPPRLTLYVSDLRGAGRHVLLDSTGIYVWPVGWHEGRIVVAVGPAFVQQGAENPYTAFAGYHLVDPSSGARVAEMCTDGAPIGTLTPAGTLCSTAGGLKVSGYDGRSRSVASASGPSCLALSPDGARVACGTQPITLVATDGTVTKTAGQGFAQGWIDERTLVFASVPAGVGPSRLSVLDLKSGVALPTLSGGTLIGTLPGGL